MSDEKTEILINTGPYNADRYARLMGLPVRPCPWELLDFPPCEHDWVPRESKNPTERHQCRKCLIFGEPD